MADPFDADGVDALFEGDLETFVARRDELVKQLKADGHAEVAAAVKQLRKPTTLVWSLNQVARANRDAVDDLVRAGREVRAAQARAVQGKDTGTLRSTTNDWRNRVRALAVEVAKLAGAHYRDEAAAALEAASRNEEMADVLRAGRLASAPDAAGFGLEGMPEPAEVLVAPAPEPSSSDKPKRNERAVKEARERLDARDASLEKETHKLRRAEQRLEQARDALADAQKSYDKAIAARDEAAAALRQAEG